MNKTIIFFYHCGEFIYTNIKIHRDIFLYSECLFCFTIYCKNKLLFDEILWNFCFYLFLSFMKIIQNNKATDFINDLTSAVYGSCYET